MARMFKRAEKSLRAIRAELKSLAPEFANWTAVIATLDDALSSIRRLKSSDRVFLPREAIERAIRALEDTPVSRRLAGSDELLVSLKQSLTEAAVNDVNPRTQS
jgi:hypothetical protein